MQIAFGQMQMSPDEFWNSTPREFFNRLNGFIELRNQTSEAQFLQTQLLMYSELMNNPYIEKRDKPKSFDDYLKSFKSDKKTEKANEVTIKTKEQLFQFMGIKDG